MSQPRQSGWRLDEPCWVDKADDGTVSVITIRTPAGEPVAEALGRSVQGARRRAKIIVEAMEAREQSRHAT